MIELVVLCDKFNKKFGSDENGDDYDRYKEAFSGPNDDHFQQLFFCRLYIIAAESGFRIEKVAPVDTIEPLVGHLQTDLPKSHGGPADGKGQEDEEGRGLKGEIERQRHE